MQLTRTRGETFTNQAHTANHERDRQREAPWRGHLHQDMIHLAWPLRTPVQIFHPTSSSAKSLPAKGRPPQARPLTKHGPSTRPAAEGNLSCRPRKFHVYELKQLVWSNYDNQRPLPDSWVEPLPCDLAQHENAPETSKILFLALELRFAQLWREHAPSVRSHAFYRSGVHILCPLVDIVDIRMYDKLGRLPGR